jgi:flavin reductase (DIM6/NTAB) family NADH-FMN oxidoreductase RutF
MNQPLQTPSSPAQPDASATPQIAAALGRIPSGLFVITWRADEVDRVMLASWVMQAGFEPPMVSVAVGTTREFLQAARGGASFVVNVLADSQRGLLARFGKPIPDGDDPFAGLTIDRTIEGVAAFAEAASWLSCRMAGEAVVTGADHIVLVARVESASGMPDAAPLVHLRKNGLKY